MASCRKSTIQFRCRVRTRSRKRQVDSHPPADHATEPRLPAVRLTTPVVAQSRDLRRVIGLAGGTALIVGITIGSGIFRTPPTIAGLVPNPLVIMGLWTAFVLISICGALAVAELSTLQVVRRKKSARV